VTSRTERLAGTLVIVVGVLVLGAVVVFMEGTLRWTLTSSALVIILCGVGLVGDARARAGRTSDE
jgi:hypothetical protein